MKKRVLTMLLAAVLVMGLLPTMAAAVDTTYKTWRQGDPRWGNMSISSSGYGHSMTWEGCYVTAVAKLLVHAGQQEQASFTPKECLQGLLNYGMLSADGGMYYNNFNNGFLQEFGRDLEKVNTDPWDMDKATAIREISKEINNGYYVIVCVSSGWGTSTHYMAVDYVSDDVYVMDNGGTIALYREGPAKGYSVVTDLVRFKYSGPYAYPAIEHKTKTDTDKPDDGKTDKTIKIQYRYHRYEDGFGEYAVCAHYGNSLPTAAGSMHVRYTEWMDSPLPVITGGPSYLVHPFQGASCINAGCVERADSTSLRYRDSAGNTWYYEETRTVEADKPTTPPEPTKPITPEPTTPPAVEPDPVPNCEEGHTWGEWRVVIPATCDDDGESERVCEVCGEVGILITQARDHKYSVKQETDAFTLYACANCGDSYVVEKKQAQPAPVGSLENFKEKVSYADGIFSDVKADDWFSANASAAYELGLMNGTGGGRFSPANSLTLGEAVTLAARLHSIYYTGKDEFPRYDGGNWYDPYVDYAREKDIISENFSFDLPATREEFVHILAAALPGEALLPVTDAVTFADASRVIYNGDVRLLQRAGVISGIPEDGRLYFRPGNTISRAEVAAVITRMAKPGLRKG